MRKPLSKPSSIQRLSIFIRKCPFTERVSKLGRLRRNALLFPFILLSLAGFSAVSWFFITAQTAPAVATSGAKAWGKGEKGQLGDGTFYPNSPYGKATPGLADFAM